MKVLYFDCFSGISGDMILGALLDLGADVAVLEQELKKLDLDGYELKISRSQKSGIFGTDVNVVLTDHGPDGIHGEGHYHSHSHENGGHCCEEHGHSHSKLHEFHSHEDYDHSHEAVEDGSDSHFHTHEHIHRNLGDILALIEKSALSPEVKELSSRIFTRLARAEAKVHNRAVHEVHFHEVGAVDSIVDIVGCAICLSQLSYDAVYCSPLSEGRGFVNCQHGLIPVPVPAVLGVLEQTEIPLAVTANEGEMVTPTGAAVLAELADGILGGRTLRMLKTGYGMGKREFHHPNLLRVSLAELVENSPPSDGTYEDQAILLETNLDDTAPEVLGYAMERLLDDGALDVWFTPIYMKKLRPSCQLSVLCQEEAEAALRKIIFRETGSIGLRRTVLPRVCLHREMDTIQTPYGSVVVKRSFFDGNEKQKAEFEDAKRLARQTGVPLREILREAGN